MGNLRDEINSVIKELNLEDEEFQLIRMTRYQQILHSMLEKFTNLKVKQINKWWWDSFLEPIYHFYPEDVFESLPLLVDEKEIVYFVIEDESKENECYWLYEGNIHAIISVLKELWGTEYYVVSKKLEWILCENHHNVLIGCGDKIIKKMKSISQLSDSDKIKL